MLKMQWFFFAGFVAAMVCSVWWTAFIIFAIVTSKFSGMGLRAVAFLALLPFFIWAAREMHRAFRGQGLDE